MDTENNSFKTLLPAALVAAVVSAAGIGLFAASQSKAPAPKAPKEQAQAPKTAPSPGSMEKEAVEALVRDYLLKNPEILIEMSSELERKQAKAEQETRNAAIEENAKQIYHPENGLVAGNPDGDVTIVEFFDYNCGFCKRAFSSLAKLIESDPKVRIVLKEFPIFGERSTAAARVVIAARKQGKYFELHSEVLKSRGQASEETALRAAEKLGLDIEKLKQDMVSAETKAIIADTRMLAEKLGIQGTPFYLVGDKVVPGAPDDLYDIFVKTVAEIRKNGCTVAC